MLFLSQIKSWFKPQSAFTFVELIIVLTILAILSFFAMRDYMLSVQKTRLQISSEELVSLFEEAQVQSKTKFYAANEAPGAEGEQDVICWAVVVSNDSAPVMTPLSWNEDDESCVVGRDFSEDEKVLGWHESVGVTSIEWASVDSNGANDGGVTSEVYVVFEPPHGEILVYLDQEYQESVTELEINISYGGSTQDIFNRVVRVVPTTSSFIILSPQQVTNEV